MMPEESSKISESSGFIKMLPEEQLELLVVREQVAQTLLQEARGEVKPPHHWFAPNDIAKTVVRHTQAREELTVFIAQHPEVIQKTASQTIPDN
jgi:5-formaminoimidazole-4-carboxamide-1-beta-D-ribofuranosyl 5'-monophosphate synthetase